MHYCIIYYLSLGVADGAGPVPDAAAADAERGDRGAQVAAALLRVARRVLVLQVGRFNV